MSGVRFSVKKLLCYATALAAAAAAAIVSMVAHYQATIYLMPTPTVIGEGKINPFALNPNLSAGTQIPVLYATNRLPAGPREDRLYTIFPGDDLHLGLTNMQIGGEDTTWDKLLSLSTSSEHGDRPPVKMREMKEVASFPIAGVSPEPTRAQQALAQLVNRALERSVDKDLTIYVHGANTGLYRASAQAAQYRHFTGRNSVVMVFLWPSAENLLGYGTDTRHALKSAPAFALLLRLLAKHSQAENINILAYSAGAQIASPALDIIGRETPVGKEEQLRLGQIYFAAGDIGLTTFVDHLQNYIHIPLAVTAAMNPRDSVLALVQWRDRSSRIGNPDPTELSEQQDAWARQKASDDRFSVIEVNADTVTGMRSRSHDFWFSHPWVSSDVLVKFLFHRPPGERGLVSTTRQSGYQVWTFPNDYPQRVQASVSEAVESEREVLNRENAARTNAQ